MTKILHDEMKHHFRELITAYLDDCDKAFDYDRKGTPDKITIARLQKELKDAQYALINYRESN